MTRCVLAAYLLCGTAAAQPTPTPPGYRVYQTIEFDRERDGVGGRIELLQDERITESRRSEMEGGDFAYYCGDDTSDPFCSSLRDVPPRPSIVRWVSSKGKVLDSRTFERELAWLDRRELYGMTAPSFSVTVDHGIGMGPFAGPRTTFFGIRRGKIADLVAERVDTREPVALVVKHALFADWRIVPANDRAGVAILAVSCGSRPLQTDEDQPLELLLRRFTWSKGRWVLHERRERGCWDLEQPFPDRTRFP